MHYRFIFTYRVTNIAINVINIRTIVIIKIKSYVHRVIFKIKFTFLTWSDHDRLYFKLNIVFYISKIAK